MTALNITWFLKPQWKKTHIYNWVFVFAAFISLLDNYESDTGVPEIVTPEEEAENHKFLDSIVQTQTMKVLLEKNNNFLTLF